MRASFITYMKVSTTMHHSHAGHPRGIAAAHKCVLTFDRSVSLMSGSPSLYPPTEVVARFARVKRTAPQIFVKIAEGGAVVKAGGR